MSPTHPGRNSPCPCGSGKKYKKCCMPEDRIASSPPDPYAGGGFSRRDRDTVLEKLVTFVRRPEFEQDLAAADLLYWGGRLDDRTEEEIDWVLTLPQVEPNFHAWLLFDLPIEEMKTFADLYLEREGGRLGRGERAYLDRALGTHYRLYEVVDVEIDRGLRLKDLWDDRIYDVQERAATHALVRWDLAATRLMEVGTGNHVIDAGIFNYPQTARGALLGELRAMHRRLRKRYGDVDDVLFFKRYTPFFNLWWLDRVAFRPFPRVQTPEGDETVPTRAYFDVVDRRAMIAGLRASPELDEDEDGAFVWFEEGGEFRRGLGRIEIRRRHLVLETFSRERGERGRDVIEAACGAAVRYRMSEHEDLARAMAKRSRTRRRAGRPGGGGPAGEESAPGAPDLPPEVLASLKKEFMDRHYRGWIDEKIPALGNRTPRHAVRLKTVRPRLVELLKEMESAESRSALEGEPPYDFGWLWKELGLEEERR